MNKKKLFSILMLIIVISSSTLTTYAQAKKPETTNPRVKNVEPGESTNNKNSNPPGRSKKNADESQTTPPIVEDPPTPIETPQNDPPQNSGEEPSTPTENSTQNNPQQTTGEEPTSEIPIPEDNNTTQSQTTIPEITETGNETITEITYTPTSPNMIGINYHSIWWHYNDAEGTTNQVLERDFALFQSQGIQTITLLIQWSYMEPTKGNYRESYIQDIKRVIDIAEIHGIQCIIDFHTAGSFSMPGWTPRRLTDIVLDEPTNQAYQAMQRYVITQLDGPNVHSFHLFNEPYLSKSTDPGATWLGVTRSQALDMLQGLYDNAKKVTTKPCSIRYGSDSVIQTSQFADDPRVWSSSDYITVNYYMAYHSEYYLRRITEKAHSLGKMVMIGEFGYRDSVNNDDNLQRERVAAHIQLFKEVGIDNAMAWIWRADRVIEDGSYAPVGGGYNMAANLNGDPRPSFYEIGVANNQLATS